MPGRRGAGEESKRVVKENRNELTDKVRIRKNRTRIRSLQQRISLKGIQYK